MGLFSLIAKLGLDTTEFSLGAKRADSIAKSIGNSVKSNITGALGAAFSVGAIAAWSKHVIDAADHIGDLADQANESTDNIQKLQTLAGKSGVEVEKYIQALVKMGEVRNAALAGDQKSLMILERFGVTMADIRGNASNLELLTKVGAAFSKVSGDVTAQADIADLFGAKMAKVVSTVNGLNDLGPIKLISEQDIKDIGALNDQLDALMRNLVRVSAPAAGFWARVLKRADANDDDSLANPVLSKAILAEIRDSRSGEDRTDPITADELKAARDKLNGTRGKTVAQEMADMRSGDERAGSEYDAITKRAKLLKDKEKLLNGNQFGFDSAASSGAFYVGNQQTASLGGGMKDLGEKIVDLDTQIKALTVEAGKLANP